MESEEDPVAQAAKLPLADRVSHKNWKVREAAYRELTDKFNIAEEDAKIYSDFLPSLSKIVRDSNAPAQLVGFDAVSKYADTAPPQLVRRVAADIAKGIVEKGLAGRPLNKAKAVEAFLTFVGADAGDLVVEAMAVTGFKHRTPKVVAAAVDAITQAVDTYGTGAVPLKAITTNLPPLFGHSQEIVRNAAKGLVIELHRWVGEPVKVVVKNAKEVTVKEVEAAFAEQQAKEKPQPKKLTRSMEQRVRERGGGGDESDEDDGFDDAGQEEEELDLAEEINLIEKLNAVKVQIEDGVVKDWYTAVDSKKWSARKEALDAAVDIIGEARIISASFQEIFSRLRKILAKDSNVNVVSSAAKLIKAMCGGLKKNFPVASAKALTVDLFGKLKEKNRVVVDAVASALDAMHLKKCIRITDLLEEISVAAKHKVPKARCELFLWLGRSIREGTLATDLKGMPLKTFGLLFLKGTDDSAPEVRDAALGGIASLQRIVGERNIAPYMEKLDKKRKDKVAAIVTQFPISNPGATTQVKKPISKRSAPSAPKSKIGQNLENNVSRKIMPESPSKRKKPSKPAKPKPYISDDEGEISQSGDEALSLAQERFEGFEKEQWSVKSFKARATAASLVANSLGEKESLSPDDVSLILGLLSSPPGLVDTNFMAIKPKLELLGMVASKCPAPLPRKTLKPLLCKAAEKFGDIKCTKMISEIMIVFAEVTSPRFLFGALDEVLQQTNNNRAVISILKFAGTVVEDFGIPAVPEKSVASIVVASIGNEAPAARSAAVTLACKASLRMDEGEFRKRLMEMNVSNEILEMFDAELQKYGREPDPPTRKKRFREASDENETVQKLVSKEEMKGPSPQKSDLNVAVKRTENVITEAKDKEIPVREVSMEPQRPIQPVIRVSIAQAFAPGSRIFLDLKNSNWKKRQEALMFVSKTIEGGGNFIKPDIGNEIIAALRARLSDSNRNIAAAAYDVLGQLISAMGPGGGVHVKNLAPAVLGQGCVDIKKNVREAAMRVLNSWFNTIGLVSLLPYCPLPMGSLNSSFRKEFLEWLVPRLQGEKGSFDASREDLSPLLDCSLTCLRDRTTEVRHLADLVLEQVIKSVGIGAVESKLLAMPKLARLQVDSILDKYRGGKGDVARAEDFLTSRNSSTPTPRAVRERPRSIAIPRTPISRKVTSGSDDTSSQGSSGSRRPRPASARASPAVSSGMGSHRLGGELSDDIPLLTPNEGREARAHRFITNRQHFIEELKQADPLNTTHPMIGEDMEDLAVDLRECCSPALCSKLTAPANRFRMHVEAIETISRHLENSPETLRYAADVLLRWSACRIEDSRTPPTVLVKLAGFVSNICEILMSSGSKLGEYETGAILPPVIEKCGSNRESLRQAMRNTLHSIGDVVDDGIFLVLLTSCLRYPVSLRAYDEISTEICRLIDKRCTSGAGMPNGVLPTMGKVAGGEDESAGRAAALCLERAHEYFGDDLWALVGDLTNMEATFLDDRLNDVVGGTRGQRSTPGAEEVHETTAPVVEDGTEGSSHQQSTSAPFPSDIRNEDFRLSIAPAPPSGVITSISDSLNMATPSKTKLPGQNESVPETPMLPSKSRHAEGANNEGNEIVAGILLKLRSADREDQLIGLASVNDLNDSGALLKHDGTADLLLPLVKCFGETLRRLERGLAAQGDPGVLKNFLKGAIRIAREPELLRRLDQNSVECLLAEALNAMIPQTVGGVEDWDQVRRGVNLMIVKILESCNQNLLYTALINHLLENIRSIQRTGSGKMSPPLAKSSICIKSIAKVTKRGFADCRVNALLRDIHLFLMANPVRRDGSSSAEDQTFAMRILKTVVNAIIDEMGANIRLHLDLIPQLDKSQLVHYIDMTLGDRKQANNSSLVDAGEDDSKYRLREAEASVTACLTKIEAEDNAEAALRQLYSVLMWCPEIDLNLHLEQYSAKVATFVQYGLGNLGYGEYRPRNGDESRTSRSESHYSLDEMWRGNISPDLQSRAGGMQVSEAMSPSTNSIHSAGQVYLKRLHEIQLRYGLQTGSRGMTGMGMERGIMEKENGITEKQPTGEEARGKASSLRERMARIRELQSEAKD